MSMLYARVNSLSCEVNQAQETRHTSYLKILTIDKYMTDASSVTSGDYMKLQSTSLTLKKNLIGRTSDNTTHSDPVEVLRTKIIVYSLSLLRLSFHSKKFRVSACPSLCQTKASRAVSVHCIEEESQFWSPLSIFLYFYLNYQYPKIQWIIINSIRVGKASQAVKLSKSEYNTRTQNLN